MNSHTFWVAWTILWSYMQYEFTYILSSMNSCMLNSDYDFTYINLWYEHSFFMNSYSMWIYIRTNSYYLLINMYLHYEFILFTSYYEIIYIMSWKHDVCIWFHTLFLHCRQSVPQQPRLGHLLQACNVQANTGFQALGRLLHSSPPRPKPLREALRLAHCSDCRYTWLNSTTPDQQFHIINSFNVDMK